MSNKISRRRVIEMAAVAGGLTLLATAGPVFAQVLRRTPSQILGPFYPVLKPLDKDADMTRIRKKSGRAAGQVIDIMGRVINSRGTPVKDARMEIWQANANGRYTHQSDRNAAALDPNFDGYVSHPARS